MVTAILSASVIVLLVVVSIEQRKRCRAEENFSNSREEIVELQESSAKQQKESLELQRTIKRSNLEIIGLRNRVDKLSRELTGKSEKVDELTGDKNELIQTLSNQTDEIEMMKSRFADIGKIIGCGHTDGPDELTALVRCVNRAILDASERTVVWSSGDDLPNWEGGPCLIIEKKSLDGISCEFTPDIVHRSNGDWWAGLRKFHPFEHKFIYLPIEDIVATANDELDGIGEE